MWVLLLVGACAPNGREYYGTTVPKHRPDEVWTNNGTEPEWIDPTKCADGAGGVVIEQLFAGLTQPHAITLRPMPDLALRWDISDEGRRYTFHLRDAQWSDGVPLTAHDFEYSWKRLLDPKTGSKYASFLWGLKNAAAFSERKADAATVGVRALDDRTLEVTLEHALPYFLDMTSYYVTPAIPRHVLERLTRAGQDPDLWTRVENIVVSGPYLLTQWKFRQYMTFEKNPRYWDAARVRMPKVKLFAIDSYNTTLNLYEGGELDYIGANLKPPSEFMDHLSRFKDFHNYPWLSVYFYWLNIKAPPLDNIKLRQALSLAVDRQAIVTHVTRGGQVPTADLVPDGLVGYRGLRRALFDPERARALLQEAGYKEGADVPPITIIYNTSEGHKQIAEAVQQMWKKHLGLRVEIENQEWKVFLKNMQATNFQVARYGWVGDYSDPYTFLELLQSHNGNNNTNWGSAAYDALLAKANALVDADARLAVLREAEALMLGEAPLIPFYVYTRAELWKPYLKGMWPNYANRHAFKYWWIDERWYDGVPTTPSASEVEL